MDKNEIDYKDVADSMKSDWVNINNAMRDAFNNEKLNEFVSQKSQNLLQNVEKYKVMAVDSISSSDNNTITVQVSDETTTKINQLVDAGLVNSRSEAIQMIIERGIDSYSVFFDKLDEYSKYIKESQRRMKREFENV